jgi:hypothetical protein
MAAYIISIRGTAIIITATIITVMTIHTGMITHMITRGRKRKRPQPTLSGSVSPAACCRVQPRLPSCWSAFS